MSKHDEARRAFLIGAAVGAGAVAGAGLVPDALAQTRGTQNAAAPATTAHSHAQARGMARSSTTTMPPRLRRSPSG